MVTDIAGYIEKLSHKNPKTKYAAAKKLLRLSEAHPDVVYPYYDEVEELLDGQNQVLIWSALRILGHLSSVDVENKTDEVFMKMVGFINSGTLISASNAIAALVEIGTNKRQYKDRVLKEIIKVEKYTYKTRECRNVVIGNVLKSIEPLGKDVLDLPDVRAFVIRQQQNARASVRKRAETLMN